MISRTFRNLPLALVALLASPFPVAAQREERSAPVSQIFFEVHSFSSPLPGKQRVDVLYRLPRDVFVFVKNPEGSGLPLIARAEITVDVVDAARGSAGHEHTRRVFPDTGSQAIQGMTSFTLPPGQYSVLLEVADGESNRTYRNEKKISVMDPLAFQILGPLKLAPDSTRDILALNYGGDIPFGRDFDVYAEIISGEDLRVSYRLTAHEGRDLPPDTAAWVQATAARGPVLQVTGSDTEALYHRENRDGAGVPLSLLLHFRGDTLREGLYELRIRAVAGDSVRTITDSFHARWFDKPLSLRSLATAIDALRYIASESEYDHMKDADPRSQQLMFDSFWERRDKTPGTAKNEVMEEYYRRVDHASQAFGTLMQQNGMKSDRGKAYILYGPPESMKRELIPSSSPREIWVYPNLHKRLIFTDQSKRGDYKLTSTEDF